MNRVNNALWWGGTYLLHLLILLVWYGDTGPAVVASENYSSDKKNATAGRRSEQLWSIPVDLSPSTISRRQMLPEASHNIIRHQQKTVYSLSENNPPVQQNNNQQYDSNLLAINPVYTISESNPLLPDKSKFGSTHDYSMSEGNLHHALNQENSVSASNSIISFPDSSGQYQSTLPDSHYSSHIDRSRYNSHFNPLYGQVKFKDSSVKPGSSASSSVIVSTQSAKSNSPSMTPNNLLRVSQSSKPNIYPSEPLQISSFNNFDGDLPLSHIPETFNLKNYQDNPDTDFDISGIKDPFRFSLESNTPYVQNLKKFVDFQALASNSNQYTHHNSGGGYDGIKGSKGSSFSGKGSGYNKGGVIGVHNNYGDGSSSYGIKGGKERYPDDNGYGGNVKGGGGYEGSSYGKKGGGGHGHSSKGSGYGGNFKGNRGRHKGGQGGKSGYGNRRVNHGKGSHQGKGGYGGKHSGHGGGYSGKGGGFDTDYGGYGGQGGGYGGMGGYGGGYGGMSGYGGQGGFDMTGFDGGSGILGLGAIKAAKLGPLALLLGVLPLGLLLGALIPNVVGVGGRRRRQVNQSLNYSNPVLDIINQYQMTSLDDPICLQRIFCMVTIEGKTNEANIVQRIFYKLASMAKGKWAEKLGLKLLFQAIQRNQCEEFICSKKKNN